MAAPHQLANLDAELVLAKRPCEVMSEEAQYKLVVPDIPTTTLATVDPVNATNVSIKILTICDPAGTVNNVVVVPEATVEPV